MNLIEQLGGYEAAKEMYLAKLKAGLAPYGYEDTLLEYRREHNIFEVGDKIIFSAMSDSVISFQDCFKMFVSQGLIKHATDAEIEAGKRL